jgi:hypothetical protein
LNIGDRRAPGPSGSRQPATVVVLIFPLGASL